MKTPEMEKIELRDWERRVAIDPSARKRDIRDIIEAAFLEGKRLKGAAQIIGIDHTTLSGWINHGLDGEIASRVIFADHELTEAA